jgi:hypothetical protein
VSHAGLALLRQLADRTGLTSGLSAALPSPLGGHDRGRVLSDLACTIADGARVISDFRVMGDQRELFGPVASVPAAWRALRGDRGRRGPQEAEGHGGGQQGAAARVEAGHRAARRAAAGQGRGPEAGGRDLHPAGRDRGDRAQRQGAGRAELQGLRSHPVIAACDNTAEPLAWMLRPGSAGSNTAADHLRLLDEAITALPPALLRRLMVTCDGAGASHALVTELDRLAARHGYQAAYSVGWELGARERAAIGTVPEAAWQIAVDGKARSASAAAMMPARTCAAPTANAGSRKRTSRS